MPNDMVRWNDLHSLFSAIFPNTIQDVMTTEEPATVLFSGRLFRIQVRPGGLDFDVYGPAFLGAVA